MRSAPLLALMFLVACVESPAPDVDDPPGRCNDQPFTPPAATGFTHMESDVVVQAGSPRHYAQDVIVVPGEAGVVDAKIAYGDIWKDLEDEAVSLYLDDCEGWRELGEATTDADGRARFTLPTDLAAGAHELRVVVQGDATQAIVEVWVIPAGSRVVISDIDGTLTTDDAELFEQILDGSHVPEAYPYGPELTDAHVARGDVVVYLSGRPYWLLDRSRAWLAGGGFADGPVHVADSNADILPMDDSVGEFKRQWLTDLQAKGFVIDSAYGNATTDIYAYAGAGVAVEQTWIIGPHAGEGGTHAVTGSWEERAASVR